MKRKIIRIDDEKCNGCGLCIPNCHEGAMQLIDGKARLVSDLFCDGLGACIGHCPEGAITVIEREAEPYDERRVMETLIPRGRNTILAHLEHLRDHNEQEFLRQAIGYLRENHIDMGPGKPGNSPMVHHGCPGSMARDFRESVGVQDFEPLQDSVRFKNFEPLHDIVGVQNLEPLQNIPVSELRQWPVQLHLLNPQASYFKNADVVLAADCTAFAMGNFHSRFLKGKSVAIACPKLDSNKESYIEKLTSMIADANIRSLTVVMMEVPCCSGLMYMAQKAKEMAGREIPIREEIVGINGELKAAG